MYSYSTRALVRYMLQDDPDAHNGEARRGQPAVRGGALLGAMELRRVAAYARGAHQQAALQPTLRARPARLLPQVSPSSVSLITSSSSVSFRTVPIHSVSFRFITSHSFSFHSISFHFFPFQFHSAFLLLCLPLFVSAVVLSTTVQIIGASREAT